MNILFLIVFAQGLLRIMEMKFAGVGEYYNLNFTDERNESIKVITKFSEKIKCDENPDCKRLKYSDRRVEDKIFASHNGTDILILNKGLEKNETISSFSPVLNVWPYFVTSCKDEDIYCSLSSCKFDCIQKYTVDKNHSSNASLLDECFTHKIKEFKDSDYVIDENKLLRVKNIGTFNESYYFIHNKSAFLCLPLAKEFVECPKWSIFSNEYKKIDYKVSINSYKHFYDVGEYYFYEKYLFICKRKNNEKFVHIQKLYVFGYLISAIFLAITLFVVCLSPNINKQFIRPLHCHITMLLCGYTTLSLRYLVGLSNSIIFCGVSGFFLQFFFLSAFFWINSHVIDLYISLKDLQPISGAIKQKQKRFVAFCVYSWVIPAIITGLTVLANLIDTVEVLNPNIIQNCWFRKTNVISAFLFYYGWIAATLVINIVLFFLLLKNFHLIGKAVQVANKNIYSQMLHISVKLFVLMSFTWVIKLIFWAIDEDEINWKISLADAITSSFHGIFVFLVYFFKIKKLSMRFCQKFRCYFFHSGIKPQPSTRSSIFSFMSLKSVNSTQLSREATLKSSNTGK